MDEELIRRLQIGFMDSISVNQRQLLIKQGISVSQVLKTFSGLTDHYNDAVDTVKWLNESSNNKICWFGDKDFPDFTPVERRIPYMLFYKGTFLNKKSNSISIVGTRQTDNDGFQESFRLGLEAGINSISVVSGLADGCDQASLYGAVRGEYPSFGILGCGLEIDYPSFSGKLKARMIDTGGAIVSRFPPYYPPLKQNFPNRNLIIAAMGDSTVVVQAPKKSGSLITCDFALQLGKEVYVSKAGIGNLWIRSGSDLLVQDGAVMINSLSDIYRCRKTVITTDDENGIRFGNKHYFIRNVI